ncbi:MAG: class I SAM-dependent methyltransferase [Eggerthellaceae bacterium]|jgi:SAM-dependent methyltransferase
MNISPIAPAVETAPAVSSWSSLDTIEHYWNGRAASYSAEVYGEIEHGMLPAWQHIMERETRLLGGPQNVSALDLGCGPGFFSMLLARMGCRVDAMDLSPDMLRQAASNAGREGLRKRIRFHRGDASDTGFAADSFNLIVLRNVTWLMRNPVAAYSEWLRILAPGGTLLVFDANWYRYLADSAIEEQRARDQVDSAILGRTKEMKATETQEQACERIATDLPMTYIDRPAWELSVLPSIGYSTVEADEDIWRTVWPQGDQQYYRSSPMFLVKATK